MNCARLRWAIKRVGERREPDVIIWRGGRPYLHRWYLIPRNSYFNLYLHRFLQGDEPVARHTHPWLFNASWLLSGAYREHTRDGVETKFAGEFFFRWGPSAHRLELLSRRSGEPFECWTLFITGPWVRIWGFECPSGFRPSHEVVVKVGREHRARDGACV